MNCDQTQERLSEYLDNRLDDAERREIEDHLAVCYRCLPEARQLSKGIKAVAALPRVEPPPRFSEQVMARIRTEAAKPTVWAHLFQPLRIKIPLHATALLLVVGLAVYLYRANEPMQQELARSTPSDSAPSPTQTPSPPNEPESITPQKQETAPAMTAPTLSASDQPMESKAPTGALDRLAFSDRNDQPLMAPGPAEKIEKLKEMKQNRGLSAGAPLTDAREERTEEMLAKRESPVAPDLLLTLVRKEKGDESGALSVKIKEIVERSGGTLYPPAAEKDPQGNIHFELDLPKSEYNRFKTELARVGEIISESHPPSSSPPTGGPRSASMQIELTFLSEK